MNKNLIPNAISNAIPKDFNWKTYIKLNSDLHLLTNKKEALKHYLNYGVYENRQYKITIPIDFDWEEYITLNPDLREITNKKDAINHYINFGFDENRIYICKKKQSDIILYDLLVNKKINQNDNLFLILNEIIKSNITKNDFFIKPKKNYYKNNKLLFPDINYNKFEIEEDLSLYSSFNILLESCKKLSNKKFFDCKFTKFSNIYDSFIVIFDLPEDFYGGSRFFINSIVDHYKNKQNFLILRPTKIDLINININNNYFFNFEYDNITTKKILNKIQDKIIKVFINHTYYFSKELIKFLFSLNKKISVITHDHYLFNDYDKTQLMYYEINNYIFDNKSFKNHFSLFENIITQNEKNLYLFKNWSHLENIVVTELPDFKLNDETVITNNEYTVIGVIGHISNIKGSDFIRYLIKCFKYTKIKIVIFGKLSNINYKHCYPYDNINDLNNLLKIHKPNMLLECSLWPETYSYTLTLSMLTELPILILKKKFTSVIDNRIKKYNKKTYFKNLNEFFLLIMKNKQNYLKTIQPIIFFNKFWNDYFITNPSNNYEDYIKSNMNKIEEASNKNIILITSKIHVSSTKFSYSNTRSIYTSAERFAQTLKTISTIKQNIPDYFIILFDNSNFTEEEILLLNENVDCFINITNNDTLNYYTNNCEYKYLADLYQQINSFYYFLKFIDHTKIMNFFKISGRYLLNNDFNYKIYDNSFNIFKKSVNVTDRDYFFTSFFKISNTFFLDYFKKLIDIFENKGEYFDLDLEVIYGKCFFENMTLVDSLGITQLIASLPEISNI
jgi:hypothetical protein